MLAWNHHEGYPSSEGCCYPWTIIFISPPILEVWDLEAACDGALINTSSIVRNTQNCGFGNLREFNGFDDSHPFLILAVSRAPKLFTVSSSRLNDSCEWSLSSPAVRVGDNPMPQIPFISIASVVDLENNYKWLVVWHSDYFITWKWGFQYMGNPNPLRKEHIYQRMSAYYWIL